MHSHSITHNRVQRFAFMILLTPGTKRSLCPLYDWTWVLKLIPKAKSLLLSEGFDTNYSRCT